MFTHLTKYIYAIFQNPGSVPAATNSRLSPLPPEPVDFNYGRGATVDIPLDSNSEGSNYKVFEILSCVLFFVPPLISWLC